MMILIPKLSNINNDIGGKKQLPDETGSRFREEQEMS